MPAPGPPSPMARRSSLVPSGQARCRTSVARRRQSSDQRLIRRRFAPTKYRIDALRPASAANQTIQIKLFLRRDRYFDWRAIAAALHQAVLLFLQVTDRVSDPNAEAHQRYQDRKRDQVHDHPVAIIDRLILFLFEPREIVEIILDRARRGGRKRWFARPAWLKFQYLAEWSGVTRIRSLDNRL